MPVILGTESERLWLDPRAGTDVLQILFVPHPGERMGASPVGKWVSDLKHEWPRCLEPLGA
jgi:putative SOS response-associated peptidase YedK